MMICVCKCYFDFFVHVFSCRDFFISGLSVFRESAARQNSKKCLSAQLELYCLGTTRTWHCSKKWLTTTIVRSRNITDIQTLTAACHLTAYFIRGCLTSSRSWTCACASPSSTRMIIRDLESWKKKGELTWLIWQKTFPPRQQQPPNFKINERAPFPGGAGKKYVVKNCRREKCRI